MTLNQKIRQLREDEGLTLAQVARATGYTVSAISRMETGSRTISWKYLNFWIDNGRINFNDIRNSKNVRNC